MKELLDLAYTRFHGEFHRERDPVSRVHRYTDPLDQEVVAFFAAVLSYGNVRTILNSVDELVVWLGPKPHNKLKDDPLSNLPKKFTHRFTTAQDIAIVAQWVSKLLDEFGSLENAALHFSRPQAPVQTALSGLSQDLFQTKLSKYWTRVRNKRTRNLRYLISDPLRGSACKRLNMYLRWVVRPNDGVDLGIWKKFSPADLILPIDTHLLKIIRELKWTKSNTASWKVAEAATNELIKLDCLDPIRYDFALCHLGMNRLTLKDLREGSHAPLAR